MLNVDEIIRITIGIVIFIIIVKVGLLIISYIPNP